MSTLHEPRTGSAPASHARRSARTWRDRSALQRAAWPALAAPAVALAGGAIAGCLVLFMHESGSELRVGGELGGPWLIAAFAAGSISKNRVVAVLTGFAALLAMLLGYYWLGNLDAGAEIAHTFHFWFVIALVAGPIMGWAGWAWLGPIPFERVLGTSVLVGCLIAEGAFFWSYGHRTVPVAEVAIGVVAVLLLPRTGRERLMTVAGTAVVTVIASVIFQVLQATYSNLFSPGF